MDSVATGWRGEGRVDEAQLEQLLSHSAIGLKSSNNLQFAFNAAAFEDLLNGYTENGHSSLSMVIISKNISDK